MKIIVNVDGKDIQYDYWLLNQKFGTSTNVGQTNTRQYKPWTPKRWTVKRKTLQTPDSYKRRTVQTLDSTNPSQLQTLDTYIFIIKHQTLSFEISYFLRFFNKISLESILIAYTSI